jgi:signal peptidase I, bacterial type
MNAAGREDAIAPPPRRRRRAGFVIEIVETLVLTVLIFLGIQTFVAQPFRVEGGSMETTLLPDQYVLIDKLTPRWAPYARGDIVVLNPPEGYQRDGTPFIKRVIGVPGDRVQLIDGIVFVNGTALDEQYLFTADGIRQPTDPTPGGLADWLVAPGQLLVMGDHRENSSDSRVFGAVSVSNIVGRAWLRYWPLDTFGTLPSPGYPAASRAP